MGRPEVGPGHVLLEDGLAPCAAGQLVVLLEDLAEAGVGSLVFAFLILHLTHGIQMCLCHNILGKLLKQILNEVGVETTYKSNHSLRATAITRMYESNVPTKLIMERSGHLSSGGLVPYERTSLAQKKAVCSALSSTSIAPLPTPECSASAPETSNDSVKEEVTDLMKRHMGFSNMTSCTFNFNLKM